VAGRWCPLGLVRTSVKRGEHHVELFGGWSVWKWVLVRGAGFDVRGVLEVADIGLGAAVERALELDAEAVPIRAEAAAALRALLRDETTPRRAVDKALKSLQRGEVPGDVTELLPRAPVLAALVERERARRHQHDLVVAHYERAREHTANVIREVAANSRFREAVLWQNRGALQRGVNWLLAHPNENTNKRARQNQHLVASYLQRYCVKNDNIGFFGPVGWGLFTTTPDEVVARPGPELLDKRTVYFEHWTIDAIAQLLAVDPDVRPFLRPRRVPTVRLEGTTVWYPTARTRQLPPAFARILALADATLTARQIATTVLEEPELGITDEAEAFEMLSELARKQFVTWRVWFPHVKAWPDGNRLALLEEVDERAGRRALAVLDTLEARRVAITAAAGDPAALDVALGELETTFEQLTSREATRKSGETYAARTLVYEDCRRDLHLELGVRFRERVGPTVSLLLQAARWYTHRIGSLYRDALSMAFDTASNGAASVDYLTFWTHAKAHFPEDKRPSQHVEQAAAELRERWGTLIAIDETTQRIDLSAATLAAPAHDVFAAPHPGWPSARYHSPDIMIAARSIDEIVSGAATFVLGELHPSVCTIHHLAQKESDDRSAMIRARETDFPSPIPAMVYAKENATRADHMWVSRQDIDIELGATRSWRPRTNVLAVGSLIVERRGHQLVVADRDGGRSFEIIEFFGSFLNAAIANDFDLFTFTNHLPRVTVDDVVIARERWRVEPTTLEFASCEAPAQQFVLARTWARSLGLPRWVFVKIPEEPKPIYVDFDSPLFVDMLAKLVRKASRMSVTEMLPTPEHAWLPDADGGGYTCELRIVCVDPTEWQAPVEPG